MKRAATILVLSLLVVNPCWACDLVHVERGHAGATPEASHCVDSETEGATTRGCSDDPAPCLDKRAEARPVAAVAFDGTRVATVPVGIDPLPDREELFGETKRWDRRPEPSSTPLYLKHSAYRI